MANKFLDGVDQKIESIKSLIKGLETKAPKPDTEVLFGILGREELVRAKTAFEKFALQQVEYTERKLLGSSIPPPTLEEFLQGKTFKSDHEKELLCKLYAHHNKPKLTSIIPIPTKHVKRIIINGKPYVEFTGEEGKARVIEEIGKSL